MISGFPASEPSLEVVPEPQHHQIPFWASRERTAVLETEEMPFKAQI